MTGSGAASAYLAGACDAAGIPRLMVSHVEPLVPGSSRPLTEQVLHAHYAGNTDELRRLCLRAEAGLAPTGIRDLTDQQLDERIRAIHALLAMAQDERRRRDSAGCARQHAERAAWQQTEQAKHRPLDPSE